MVGGSGGGTPALVGTVSISDSMNSTCVNGKWPVLPFSSPSHWPFMLVLVTFMMSPTSSFSAVLSYAFGTRACLTCACAGNFRYSREINDKFVVSLLFYFIASVDVNLHSNWTSLAHYPFGVD